MQTAVPIWLAETVSVFGAACKTKLEGPGEPEEAIRAPLESLLTSVGSRLGLSVVAHGEAALKELGARPDYAIRVNGAITGYIEVKKPRLSIDDADFRGLNWTGRHQRLRPEEERADRTARAAYLTIAQTLKTEVLDGMIPQGQALPSESVMAKRFGVARIVDE